MEHVVHIDRTPAEVFAFFTDVRKAPSWQTGVVSAEPEGPLAVGVGWREKRTFLGKTVEGSAEVTAFEPGRRFAATSRGGPFPVRFEWELAESGRGTRMTFRAEAEPGGFLRLAQSLAVRSAKRQIEHDLATAKGLLEERTSPGVEASIDLNSDLGEGAGTDAVLMPLISTANVACGAHAGGPDTMRATVALAAEHGVAIGAHPGYRDRANFGRVPLDVPHDALREDITQQIEDLRFVVREQGAALTHVKAHGALYNRGERDDAVAAAIVEAVRAAGGGLVLFATPPSAMARAARAAGLRVAREGFVDRAYEPDGTLRSRRLEGALITEPAAAAAQAVTLARGGTVDTLCLHGDTPGAPAIARAIRGAFEREGIAVRAFAA